MWSEGMIQYGEQNYRYCVKHFDQPSQYGYKEGRASKIWIQRNGVTVFNYDRGDDVPCTDKDTEAVLTTLLKKYN